MEKIMELKIKDDVNLEILKNFGLKFCTDGAERYEYERREKGKPYRYILVFCWGRQIRSDGSNPILFDLIQAGLVEKTEVK